MSQDSLHDLLHDGVPNPPPALMAPPWSSIRRRVRRRRLAAGVGTAAAVLLIAGLGTQVISPERSSAPGNGASAPPVGTWIFVVVGTDDRSLVVVREGVSAADPCPGASPFAQMPLPAPVGQESDRVVLPMPALARDASCVYRMPVRLDAPLGARVLVGGADHRALPALPERILPRPTYPAGIGLDTTFDNILGNAPRPGWVVEYSRPDGLAVTVSATLAATAPTLPSGEHLHAHGYDMQIVSLVPGKNNIVLWVDAGWEVSVMIEPADHSGVTRAELQRVIDGLTWP